MTLQEHRKFRVQLHMEAAAKHDELRSLEVVDSPAWHFHERSSEMHRMAATLIQ